MNLKEHLQFLVMMIPTLLLIVAVVVTLALPVSAGPKDALQATEEVAILDTEIGPIVTVAVR